MTGPQLNDQGLALRPELSTEQQRRAIALVLVHGLFPASPPSVALDLARWITSGTVVAR